MDQNRVWLAILLSLGLFFAYDYFVIRPYREAETRHTPTSTLPAPAGAPKVEPAPAIEPEVPVAKGEPVVVETDLFVATFDSVGGKLRGFELKRFDSTVEEGSPRLNLVPDDAKGVLPLTVEVAGTGSDAAVAYKSNKTTFSVSGSDTVEVELLGELLGGQRIEKRFRFTGSSYAYELSVTLPGARDPAIVGTVITPLAADSPDGHVKAVAFASGKLVERDPSSMIEEESQLSDTQWAGYAGRYFVSLVVSEQQGRTAYLGALRGVPVVRVDETTEGGTARYKVLMGPKDREVLGTAGSHLDRAVDYGWFWFIAIPLLYLLRAFQALTGNYGVAIVLLTVLVKVATIPLTRVQFRSMQKMQAIQPHLERLRERTKDDPAAMQREMMDLYRKHGVNPFSGCVPMLLQIPIFVGLYNALLNAIELRHAPFVGWIRDLSAPDSLIVAGVPIPVLVILMGASMLVQQWMTPMQGDPAQRRMMMFMPVIFTAMFLNFPSGLVLYWLVNNVISIFQQYVVMKNVPQRAQA